MKETFSYCIWDNVAINNSSTAFINSGELTLKPYSGQMWAK